MRRWTFTFLFAFLLAGPAPAGQSLAVPPFDTPPAREGVPKQLGARGELLVQFATPEGEPVEGQAVRLYVDNPPVGSLGSEDVKTDYGCRTDASGTCRINGLLAGDYVVAHESNCCGATVGGIQFVESQRRRVTTVAFVVPPPPG